MAAHKSGARGGGPSLIQSFHAGRKAIPLTPQYDLVRPADILAYGRRALEDAKLAIQKARSGRAAAAAEVAVPPQARTAAPQRPLDNPFSRPAPSLLTRMQTPRSSPVQVPYALPTSAPPRPPKAPVRPAGVVRVETPAQYAVGPYNMMGHTVSEQQVRYAPKPFQAGPYDVSDADVVQMMQRDSPFGPGRKEDYVIGLDGTELQGRRAPRFYADWYGGYVDPRTGKEVRISGDHGGANRALNRQIAAETQRRKGNHDRIVSAVDQQPTAERRMREAALSFSNAVLLNSVPQVYASLTAPFTDHSRADVVAGVQTLLDEHKARDPKTTFVAGLTGDVVGPGKIKKAGKIGAIAFDTGKDLIGGAFEGYNSTPGDPRERWLGAARGGALEAGFGRVVDGGVHLSERGLDAWAPKAMRWMNGSNLQAARMVGDATRRDGLTLNALGATPAAWMPTFAGGTYVDGLAQATANSDGPGADMVRDALSPTVRPSRPGQYLTVPELEMEYRANQIRSGALTPEAQAFARKLGEFDFDANLQVGQMLSGDPDALTRNMEGLYIDQMRQNVQPKVLEVSGTVVKRQLAERAEAMEENRRKRR